MKLFFGTNEQTAETPLIKMLEVSVKSALKNTNFEIFVIFDGDKNKLNLPSDVRIIEHKHRCYETFKNSLRCFNDKNCLAIASGAYLRTEIPYLIKKMGLEDEVCLYTDYDVIFQYSNFSVLESLKPPIFAAAPEFNPNEWSYVNTGVMLMNVNYFNEHDNLITDYINNNFEDLHTWDQTLYNNLYSKNFTKLPINYNWKPYWGINENANIIHFHGVKPFKVNPKKDMLNTPILKSLYNNNQKSYDYYNELFNSYL
jgi:hypothetical protein